MYNRWIVGLSLVIPFLFSSCRDVRIIEHNEWKQYFDKYGIKNECFMLRDNNHESVHYLNKERCITRFTPASTFKIFNSLVALETAVASDDQLVIKWDGVTRNKPEWNKDMTMREAFKVSCVPYYQEIARRIGEQKMKKFIDSIHYGNTIITGKVDEFWLNDTLQISADEQVGFLKRMYFYQLPISERSQRIVKTMMLQEENPNYNLYYKTGTSISGNKSVCWIVGFAEKIEHIKELEGSMNKADFRNYPYFFAMNFEMPQIDTVNYYMDARKEILHQVLKDYGVLSK